MRCEQTAHGYWRNEMITAAAARRGNLSVARWAMDTMGRLWWYEQRNHHLSGCTGFGANCDDVDFYCSDYTFGRAAEGGDMATMRFLRDRGCPWTEVTCADAAGAGQLEALEFLIESGCPWDRRMGERAAFGGWGVVVSPLITRSFVRLISCYIQP